MRSRPAWFLIGLLLGGLAVGFFLLRASPSSGWASLLPAVKADLRERMGFVPGQFRLLDTLDLTGDGRNEAIVVWGGGATLEEGAVYGLEKGEPEILMREVGNRMEPMLLRKGAGGAGRYGADFWITPEGAVVQGVFRVEGTPRDSCTAMAFRWDPDRKRFVVDAVLTAREGERFCRKICLNMKKTPLRDLFAPLCSGLD